MVYSRVNGALKYPNQHNINQFGWKRKCVLFKKPFKGLFFGSRSFLWDNSLADFEMTNSEDGNKKCEGLRRS